MAKAVSGKLRPPQELNRTKAHHPHRRQSVAVKHLAAPSELPSCWTLVADMA